MTWTTPVENRGLHLCKTGGLTACVFVPLCVVFCYTAIRLHALRTVTLKFRFFQKDFYNSTIWSIDLRKVEKRVGVATIRTKWRCCFFLHKVMYNECSPNNWLLISTGRKVCHRNMGTCSYCSLDCFHLHIFLSNLLVSDFWY